MAALDIRAILRDKGIGRRLRGVMVVAFLALILAGGAAVWMTGRSQQHIRAVSHTYAVENAVLDARQLLERGETTRRGYLLAPGQRDFLAIYRRSAQALPDALKRIRRLTSDNPVQVAYYATLLDQVRRLVVLREESIARITAGDVAGARAAFPPSGVPPGKGLADFVYPLCFIYSQPAEIYCAFRALWSRYWCKLHSQPRWRPASLRDTVR